MEKKRIMIMNKMAMISPSQIAQLASTAEFSHDTDANEIDSLAGL